MRAQILNPAPCDWDNFWKWTGPEGIVIADVPSGRRPEVVGKTVAEAAEAAGKDPIEFALRPAAGGADGRRDDQLLAVGGRWSRA